MKFLICGLGNPGPQYELTRHNAGFLVLDRLADRLGVRFSLDRHGWVANAGFRGKQLLLLKPNTFMNLSGKAVRYWQQDLKIEPSQIMVVTDELAFDFGAVKLKSKGSSGGHNGLKSIEESIATQDYPRIRFGIGSNFAKGRQSDYVLQNFSAQEFKDMLPLLDKACDIVETYILEGIELAMTRHNGKGA